MTNLVQLLQKIEAAFPRLPRQLQRAARHVVDNNETLAFVSMRSAAQSAGVSPATMLRLARYFDFPDYECFLRAFRQASQPSHQPIFSEKARSLQLRFDGIDASGLIQSILDSEACNLSQTLAAENLERLIEAAQLLRATARILVTAGRSCQPLASFFAYALGMVRDDVQLLSKESPNFPDGLRELSPADTLFVAGFTPYTREIVEAAHFAHEQGVKIVALTDSRLSPLAQVADACILVENRHPSFFQSITAAMAATQALVAMITIDGGNATLSKIAAREALLTRFNAYWDGTAPVTAPPHVSFADSENTRDREDPGS